MYRGLHKVDILTTMTSLPFYGDDAVGTDGNRLDCLPDEHSKVFSGVHLIVLPIRTKRGDGNS
ncbi:MAG: hypothetical protein M3456_14340 [Actinomycetota bacterium]|nr:hypothetical protein [Actinomycetota bacterium]